jgi:hypothetical protein
MYLTVHLTILPCFSYAAKCVDAFMILASQPASPQLLSDLWRSGFIATGA